MLANAAVASIWIKKLLSYQELIPAFSVANTWKGASEIVKEFRYELTQNIALLTTIEKPVGVNFVPCIAWKPTSDTIVRYKLWEDVGEILYVPLYSGQKVGKNFSIEIWSTNADPISLNEPIIAYDSRLVIPSSFCDDEDRNNTVVPEDCTDVTFDLSDYVPQDGDYYVVVGLCGLTQLIKGPSLITTTITVKSINDDTWHKVGLLYDSGNVFVYVDQNNEAPADKEYIPLYWRSASSPGLSTLPIKVQVQKEGTDYLLVVINEEVDDDDGIYKILFLATDLKYYALRLRKAGDTIYPEVEQTETVI